MDPYSTEGELLNIHNYFHQAQYQAVLDHDTSDLSPENQLTAKILKYRARIALGQAADLLRSEGDRLRAATAEPELQAVAALATAVQGDTDKAVSLVERVLGAKGDSKVGEENATVQVLGGLVFQLAGRSDDALALLSQHQGNLEALALIVQIYLAQNRTELAAKEVLGARRWAQDSLLVNLAESWVGVRQGGEKYQQAFYVFEELAQAPSTTSVTSLVSQAVTELHLGRVEEAAIALEQALQKDGSNPEAIANSIVLSVITGKDVTEQTALLQKADAMHPFLTDLQAKSELFDAAASKYSASVKA